MNPIPQAPPNVPLFANGYLDILQLAVIAMAFLVLVAVAVMALRTPTRERVRLFCPVRLRRVAVLFRLGRGSERVDVERCSVFRGRPITCGKVCLHLREQQ